MTRRKKALVQIDLWGNPIESEAQPNGDIIPLDFETHAVRMLIVKGQPQWVAADVCRALELIGDPGQHTRRLDDDEKGLISIQTPGGNQQMLVVNESGLYQLIFASNKPEAKRFKRWITHEVIPTIRKTGSYSLPRGRVAQIQKRLGCDVRTAEIRKDQYEINSRQAKNKAALGACPNDYKAWHNAGYRGQFDRTAAELREMVHIDSSETPLDYMAEVPLSCNKHAKILAERIARDAEDSLTLEQQASILEMVARQMSEADMERLGDGYAYGVIDDQKRGRVIDVVNRQISHTG